MKKFKKLAVILLTMVMMLNLAACGSDDKESKTKLVLGTSADYPPFEFITLDENNKQQYQGIDVYLAQQIAQDMGLELEIVNMSFENLTIALQKGEVDIVIAAIEKNEKRDAVADFSDPYYTDLPPMVLVRAEDKDKYSSLDDFEGKTVGAQTSTTKADIVTNDMKGANLLALSSVTDLANNLEYNKCDAIVVDGAVAEKYAEENSNFVVADVTLGEAYPYSVAVAEGDPSDLLKDINSTISKVTSDGTMDEWIEKADSLSGSAIDAE